MLGRDQSRPEEGVDGFSEFREIKTTAIRGVEAGEINQHDFQDVFAHEFYDIVTERFERVAMFIVLDHEARVILLGRVVGDCALERAHPEA